MSRIAASSPLLSRDSHHTETTEEGQSRRDRVSAEDPVHRAQHDTPHQYCTGTLPPGMPGLAPWGVSYSIGWTLP